MSIGFISSIPQTCIGPNFNLNNNSMIPTTTPLQEIIDIPDDHQLVSVCTKNWDTLFPAAISATARGEKAQMPARFSRGLPQNVNTVDSTLVTAFLAAGSVTPLQNILAPLSAFTRDFSMDPYKPRASVEVKFIASGSTTLTISQGSSFESGDANFTNKEVVMGQYSQPFQINNFDLQGGMRLADLVEINAAIIGNKIIELATAPITEANFPNPMVSAPGAFGWSDMAGAWALLKKSTKKSAILDGEYTSMMLNAPGMFQQGMPSGVARGLFGWDGIYTNTDWTGAGAGVRGFFCAPQAIGVVAGMPLEVKGGGQLLASATFQVPGVGITIATHNWLSLATRTMWQSYDVMFGASLLDPSAGIILKSA